MSIQGSINSMLHDIAKGAFIGAGKDTMKQARDITKKYLAKPKMVDGNRMDLSGLSKEYMDIMANTPGDQKAAVSGQFEKEFVKYAAGWPDSHPGWKASAPVAAAAANAQQSMEAAKQQKRVQDPHYTGGNQ